MPTIASSGSAGKPPDRRQPEGLPVRWPVIAILAVAAGALGFVAGGVIPAVTLTCAVATAAHKLIA